MSQELEDLIQKGVEAADRNELDLAEAHFREALRLNPGKADVLLDLGVICYFKRDLDRALDLISQCIAADPAQPKAHHHRGMVSYAKGDLNGSLADFDAELQLHPDDVEAILSRGVTLSHLGKKTESLASYERAMRLAPRDPRPYFNRGLLREKSDPDGAILDFSEAIDRDPRKADAYMGRAVLLRRKGRKQEALADFQAFLQLDGPRLHGNGERVRNWIQELEREISGSVGQSSPRTISELISQMSATGDKRAVAELESMFSESVFGLLMSGLPKAEPGQKLVVDGSGSVAMQFVSDPSGRSMIKACADPELFDRNYPGCINVTMTGRELLEMAEKVPDAEGVLVCSAISFHSLPIYRAAYQRFRRVQRTDNSRKWWQLWKT